MALINTEEAAKRLARVILSDIELYSRERPQEGESLAAQIEEGRRLFGRRVTPAIMPVFDMVLADRRAANDKTPVTVEVPSTFIGGPTGAPVATPVQPMAATPVQPMAATPVQPMAATPVQAMAATPARPTAVVHPPEGSTPVQRPILRPRAADLLPATSATPVAHAAPVTPVTPGAIGSPPSAAPPRAPSPAALAAAATQIEMPIPVLTSRISIPRLLALVAVAVAAFVFLGRFVR